MPEPLAWLLGALRAFGCAPALLVAVPGVAGTAWALYLWADEARPRGARRAAGAAALLLGFGLLLRLGLALLGPPALMPPWQWAIGLLVLPLFIRSRRLGGVAAMLFFLCLAVALGTAVSWVGDVRVVAGAALALGGAALVAGVLLGRWLPRPAAAPGSVPPAALQARLDLDEANEAADKYTRE